MIGDNLIITNRDKKRAKVLMTSILHFKNKFIITIGGAAGTGKSECAICIQEELYKRKISSLKISLDDYYKLNFFNRNKERKNKGIKTIGLDEIYWWTVLNNIYRFYKKKIIYIREFDKYARIITERSINTKNIKYLIIDGIYANYLKYYLSVVIFAIHIKGTSKQTLKFRIERNKENETDKFRIKVVDKEYKEVLKLEKYADMFIDYKNN